jgi:hypothetical protein
VAIQEENVNIFFAYFACSTVCSTIYSIIYYIVCSITCSIVGSVISFFAVNTKEDFRVGGKDMLELFSKASLYMPRYSLERPIT